MSITLGLEKDKDIDRLYFPRTLRIDDNDVDKSDNAVFADFIFEKELELENSKYDIITFQNQSVNVPDTVKHLLTDDLWEKLNQHL